jgi:hypothetical protein
MERSIEASTTIPLAFARAREVLLDDPGAVFNEAHTVAERCARRFRLELRVDLGAGASVHQEVTLQLGAARSTETGLVLPLAWQAKGRERLFPTFDGELEASEARTGTGLRLRGAYTVPLGVLGGFGNAVVGRRLARRSLGALVERLAWRLESAAERRLDSVSWHREPNALARHEHEHEHPEIYIG